MLHNDLHLLLLAGRLRLNLCLNLVDVFFGYNINNSLAIVRNLSKV